jgi:hypothetical protein
MAAAPIQGAILLVMRPAAAVAGGLSQATLALAERAVAVALRGELVEIVARDLVRYEVVERAFARIGPDLELMVERALDTPAVERTLARIVESPVVQDAIAQVADDAVARLRESEALWALINDVVQSPVVTEAIAHQGMGFADQVGDDIRERSRRADARLERVAWRLLRRHSEPGGGPAPSGAT